MLGKMTIDKILRMASDGKLSISAIDISNDYSYSNNVMSALSQGGKNGIYCYTRLQKDNTAMLVVDLANVAPQLLSFVISTLRQSPLDFVENNSVVKTGSSLQVNHS